ncbi:hypothetical protein RJ640_008136 [Escallonia rubra]|uniref:Uncharacterized protein n=1 Tax=Escallonia rubra TaxID=112253 RepID=A0AA88UIA9_9ASTE|nr:hypothetical protein RJ640_008136 [Escallonia rubra]
MLAGVKPPPPPPARPMSESRKSGTPRWFFGAGEPVKDVRMDDEKRRAREAEKAEKIVQLIFWGPHNI